jgi:hypothetical protein
VADPATLVWLNRPDDARGYFWHVAAPLARTVTVDEVGPHCAIRVETPARLLVQSFVPPATSLTRDEAGFRHALHSLLDGAASPRVLAVGRVGQAERWHAMLAAFDPDICDLPTSLHPPAGFVGVEPAAGVPEWHWFARKKMEEALREWQSRATPGCRPALAVHSAADLLATGFLPPRMEADQLVRRTGKPRRCTLLLPGGSENVGRIVLELAAPRRTLSRDGLRIRLDGVEADVLVDPATPQVVAEFFPVAPALCHRLEILRDADTEFALVAVALQPA